MIKFNMVKIIGAGTTNELETAINAFKKKCLGNVIDIKYTHIQYNLCHWYTAYIHHT